MAYQLTREQLRLDLFVAFVCAKKHKGNRPYVLYFERNLEENLDALADELWNRTYHPEPSTCFIVKRPKKREVFAAQFRDRVVHHLYYNYTHQLYEQTFIRDTYSCIEGRGTHDGQKRLARHIRQESRGGQRQVYIMKLDKRGYFMHINRTVLLRIALRTLNRMASHRVPKDGEIIGGTQWRDVIDIPFVCWLTQEIVLLDPRENCRIVGSIDDWSDLDHAKSLFYTLDGCGLPIGNLTSQLLSNVYLNEFDQFMKTTLHCRHYGRYVDDSYVVSADREWLHSLVPSIRKFLKDELCLDLHMGKLHIVRANHGVEFLGVFLKYGRGYISSASLHRIKHRLVEIKNNSSLLPIDIERSVNSYLGILSHTASYNIRAQLFYEPFFLSLGSFNRNLTRFRLSEQYRLTNIFKTTTL